ncbi:phytoene/squalene synthase family protein [Mucilaginibacter limnophilus]|uniref:Phytoene/squalene synthase family protein n=1 Tax=Mucilaginibacter limnophilus TaxID=1932778 RepID=A0A437MVE1_9SPHI|nr:phytoene/squalene synthase family protein [Mucilaginibacter limnophilus]RVU01603.1 phytoene/squalene synthase family protein [Mucilaginibacter limnophilus]
MPKISDLQLYNDTCFDCSKLVANRYSTSFSLGIKAFSKKFRAPIYAIYGFVRCADEIVDTFHNHDKETLIADFKAETYKAIAQGLSLNPVLHAFQAVVNKYDINPELIEAFLTSMEMDLYATSYDEETYHAYIYGSAEVVGLMCLKVFCENDDELYRSLMPMACSLGAAFQKINFLRDVKADKEERGRVYFPGIDLKNFTEQDKKNIELDIERDFNDAFEGIKKLPAGARLGVYIAYVYYKQLFKKISCTPADDILQKRIRISDRRKVALYAQAILQQKLNAI